MSSRFKALYQLQLLHGYARKQLVPSPYNVGIACGSARQAAHLIAELGLADASQFGVKEEVFGAVLLHVCGNGTASYLLEGLDAALGVEGHEHTAKVEYYVLFHFCTFRLRVGIHAAAQPMSSTVTNTMATSS